MRRGKISFQIRLDPQTVLIAKEIKTPAKMTVIRISSYVIKRSTSFPRQGDCFAAHADSYLPFIIQKVPPRL
jgi:hypothetical protein